MPCPVTPTFFALSITHKLTGFTPQTPHTHTHIQTLQGSSHPLVQSFFDDDETPASQRAGGAPGAATKHTIAYQFKSSLTTLMSTLALVCYRLSILSLDGKCGADASKSEYNCVFQTSAKMLTPTRCPSLCSLQFSREAPDACLRPPWVSSLSYDYVVCGMVYHEKY